MLQDIRLSPFFDYISANSIADQCFCNSIFVDSAVSLVFHNVQYLSWHTPQHNSAWFSDLFQRCPNITSLSATCQSMKFLYRLPKFTKFRSLRLNCHFVAPDVIKKRWMYCFIFGASKLCVSN